jgi:hypothetical protein
MFIENLYEGKSFFYIRKDLDFPPDSTTYFEEYSNSEKLSLNITQLYLTPKEQSKLIDIWCEKIPQLKKLKYLWFQTRVNQKIFDAVCENHNIEFLYIKWSGIIDISNIVKLQNLKYLKIGSSTKIENLKYLKELRKLVVLEIENTQKISDYSFLAEMPQLLSLELSGSMWTTLNIDSLKPFRKLDGLIFLGLGNTKILDADFTPLTELKNLLTLYPPLIYKRDIYKYLHSNLPNLKFGDIEKGALDDEYCKEYKIK